MRQATRAIVTGIAAAAPAVVVAILATGGGGPVSGSPAPARVVGTPPPVPEPVTTASPARRAPVEVGRTPATLAPKPAAEPPAQVSISAVGVDVGVVPVGVTDEGGMELPPDPNVLGWYRYGPTAGEERGSVVLAGHVDTIEHGLGPLARLREAAPGDEVFVETADGDSTRYVIEHVESIPKAKLPLAELFRRGGDARLVLLTCGGEFTDGAYTENVVVIAAPS